MAEALQRASAREALLNQSRACFAMGSPLYGRLLEDCAKEKRNRVLDLLAERASNENLILSASVLRLMGAVHRLAINAEAPQLAQIFPSCGGNGDARQALSALLSVVESHGPLIRESLDYPVQTNEVGRSAALLIGFLFVAKRFKRPIRLLEIGASGGLLLRWDHFRYIAKDWSWGEHEASLCFAQNFESERLPFSKDLRVDIIERSGCDLSPIDAASVEGRQRLMSFVWPDQMTRLQQLTAACEIAAEVPAQVDKAHAADWLAGKLASNIPHTATVIYHSVMLQYLTPEERNDLAETIQRAGASATESSPLAYLSLEPRPGRKGNIILRLWPGDVEFELGHASLHGRDVRCFDN